MLKLLFRMSPTPTRSNTRQANDNRQKKRRGGKRDLTEIRQLAQLVVVVVVVVVPPLPRLTRPSGSLAGERVASCCNSWCCW